jgi:hypothetical protein
VRPGRATHDARGRRSRRARGWLYAPPPFLDPLLVFAERVDRRLRHVRPVTPNGFIAVELGRHRGGPVLLPDGTRVGPGDPLVKVHFRNERIRTQGGRGWNAQGWRRIRLEMAIVADWATRLPPGRRPVAFRGTTILDALLRREGWLVRPRPRTFVNRVEDWFMRWLLAHWAPAGRARLDDDRRLGSVDGWLSRAEFEARYAGRRASPASRPMQAR